MLVSINISMKTLNNRDFRHKNHTVEHFSCRIHRKLRTFNEIFPKNQEICIFGIKLTTNLTTWVENSKKSGNSHFFGIKLTTNLTTWVENSEKSDFSGKTSTNFHPLFLQINTCGYILVQKQNNCFTAQNRRGNTFTNYILQNTPQLL